MRKDVKWPKRLTAVESRNETNFSIMTYFVVPLCHGCENWDCPVGTPGNCVVRIATICYDSTVRFRNKLCIGEEGKGPFQYASPLNTTNTYQDSSQPELLSRASFATK